MLPEAGHLLDVCGALDLLAPAGLLEPLCRLQRHVPGAPHGGGEALPGRGDVPPAGRRLPGALAPVVFGAAGALEIRHTCRVRGHVDMVTMFTKESEAKHLKVTFSI